MFVHLKILNFSKGILIAIKNSEKINKYFWVFSSKKRICRYFFGNIYFKVVSNILFIKSKNISLVMLYLKLLSFFFSGVQKEYNFFIELRGTGFKFEFFNFFLKLKLGFSHDIKIKIYNSIKLILVKPTLLNIKHVDFQYLTEFCSKLKFLKKLDSYKGKGVCFKFDKKLLKEGKKVQN